MTPVTRRGWTVMDHVPSGDRALIESLLSVPPRDRADPHRQASQPRDLQHRRLPGVHKRRRRLRRQRHSPRVHHPSHAEEDPRPPDDPYLDLTRLRGDTGFESQDSLETGIEGYVSWLRAGNARRTRAPAFTAPHSWEPGRVA
jgi:hypothetical protein